MQVFVALSAWLALAPAMAQPGQLRFVQLRK
jgi:hypothetical protein